MLYDTQTQVENDPSSQLELPRYWAAEEDPAVFVKNLKKRVATYHSRLKETRWLGRMMRSFRYYHGLFFQGAVSQDTAIVRLGEQGELAGLAVNDFRSLLQQILAMVTKDRAAIDIIAKSSDLAALTQARLGKLVAEEYLRRAEPFRDRSVEHALLFNVGYISTLWDPYAGEEYDADPITNEILYTGDIKLDNPTVFDVVFDHKARTWEEVKWVLVRSMANKWDLAAQHPEIAEKILGQSVADDDEGAPRVSFQQDQDEEENDLIDKWCFYHLPTPSLLKGRYAEYVGDELIPGYEMTDMPYKEIPLERVTAGEMLLTCFGYSPALDMQGPQEALNAETSTIASAHASMGLPKLWTRTGDDLMPQYYEGFTLLSSDSEPKLLDFNRPMVEQQKGRDSARMDLQLLSGVNDVRRGNPEGALKGGSGSAFAFLDAKSLEQNSGIKRSSDRAVEGVGTKILRYLSEFTEYPRYMGIPGKHNRPYQVLIQKDGFSHVDKCIVKAANPLLSTTAGKFEIAQILLQQKRITNEEYITFLQTGNLDTMLEAANAQLSLVREENEAMLDGRETVAALGIDDHVLHIREHAALLNTTDSRNDIQLTSLVLGHIMSHMQALISAGAQMQQLVLGYDLPLPALGAPGQAGPGGQAQGQQPRQPGQTQGLRGSIGHGAGEPGMPRAAQSQTASGIRSEAA